MTCQTCNATMIPVNAWVMRCPHGCNDSYQLIAQTAAMPLPGMQQNMPQDNRDCAQTAVTV